MCCCNKPNINGEPGAYSWDGKTFSTRRPNPPALQDGDELLHDEPGRCGGTDSHCHHLRVVKQKYGGFALLIRHGGGDERVSLGYSRQVIDAVAPLDTNARYWLLIRLYYIQREAVQTAVERVNGAWRKAAAEKRIKTRKTRNGIKVWTEPEAA